MTREGLPGGFRLSAHLGYLFAKVPLAGRFAAARRAGFRAIEIPDPYSLSPADFRDLCEENELEVAQIALPNGNSARTSKGLAAIPDRCAEFDEALMQSLMFAKAVKCESIHPMAGTSAPLESEPEWEVYLSNLARASSAAAGENIRVIIEPIGACGVRNYFMNSLPLACSAIELVKAPNLFLSLDTYHAAAMGADLPAFIAKEGPRIGHVQLADWPRRDEPGSGQIAFEAVFAALARSGYSGYVGLEYVPSSGAGFDWLQRFSGHLEPLRAPTD